MKLNKEIDKEYIAKIISKDIYNGRLEIKNFPFPHQYTSNQHAYPNVTI